MSGWGAYVCYKTAHEGGGMLSLANNYAELDWDKVFEEIVNLCLDNSLQNIDYYKQLKCLYGIH